MVFKLKGWYPVTPLGRTLTAAYVCVPAYVMVSQWLDVYPPALTVPIVGGMSLVMICAATAKQQKKPLFMRHGRHDRGFTLVELLVVISIIGMLITIVFPVYLNVRKAAYDVRAKAEMREIAVALERYAIDNGGYPPDANRDLPSGIEKYLPAGNWPKAPWPGSVYDWDNWSPTDMAYPPNEQTYQISIRFCTDVNNCTFPNETWAQNFDYYSAAYYCISGSCRAHVSQPLDHPAYCVNCSQ